MDKPEFTYSTKIRLSDGRNLAYKETGVPKEKSNYRIIFVHGFNSSKESSFLAPQVGIFLHNLTNHLCSFTPGWSQQSQNFSLRGVKKYIRVTIQKDQGESIYSIYRYIKKVTYLHNVSFPRRGVS